MTKLVLKQNLFIHPNFLVIIKLIKGQFDIFKI